LKLWKVLVLLAGFAGLAGFFLPFIEVTHTRYNARADISALQLVRGPPTTPELAKQHTISSPKGGRRWSTPALRRQGLDVPQPVIARLPPRRPARALGLAGVARGRFGRFGSLLALVLGIARRHLAPAPYVVARQGKGP
jgi:hypothetical protein